MLSPVSVTSDGMRLFVTDLGFNRVLIFNSHPHRQRRRRRCGPGTAGPGQFDRQ